MVLNMYNKLYVNGTSYFYGTTYLNDQVGIGYDPVTSGNTYKLYVNGTSYLNGEMTVAGNILPATNITYTLGSDTHEFETTYTRQIYARYYDSSANYTDNRDIYYGYNSADNHYFYTYDGTTRTHRATINATGLLINQPAANRNAGIIGTYDYTKAALIWSMGTSYNVAADGSGLGNLYGAAYGYQGQTYLGSKNYAGGHQFIWCNNGSPQVALGSNGIWIKKGGGLYWDPYVESESDTSDVTSIYQITSGVAGGTELRINQQNDATDVINLCTNSHIYMNSKKAFTINDSWLRINEDKGFSSGIYTGSSLIRSDNQLQVGNAGANFYANSSGNGYFSNTLTVASHIYLSTGARHLYMKYGSTNYNILHNHNNGNVSLNAASGGLYIGYQNTTLMNWLNGKATLNSSGDFTAARYVYASYYNASCGTETPSTSSYWVYADTSGWFRKSTNANWMATMRSSASGTWGINVTGTASTNINGTGRAMQIRYGGVTLNNNSQTTVTFSPAFSNACLTVIPYDAHLGFAAPQAISVGSISRTGCKMYQYNAQGAACSAAYVAFGY